MDIWAVCLYQRGGDLDGMNFLEFVRAVDRKDAIMQAINLNTLTAGGEAFDVVAASRMPEDI